MRSLIKKFYKIFSVFSALAILAVTMSSCNSTPAVSSQGQVTDKQIQQLDDKMFANEKPENHFDEIRDYVFEQYPDLPDDVEALVKNTKPKFVKNETKMEYCFFWVLPDGSIVEVVTTPPPLCDPIAIHHSKQIKYE